MPGSFFSMMVGVFPPETWHRIEAQTEDTVFNIDFYVDPKILAEG